MKLFTFLLFTLLPYFLLAQEDKLKNWALNGYVKNLQTILIPNDLDFIVQQNLVHNRLNFKWYLNNNWTFKSDLRTRIFYGQYFTGFGESIDDVNNDYFDLSTVLVDKQSFIVHTMLDRLYIEYSKDKWEVRLGRHRINWGINTFWNPNDIFNAFAFTDFDYEERPGSDALRVTYFPSYTSSFEIAIKAFEKWEDAVAAMLWKTNKWNYDFQFLAGVVKEDIVLGTGWAGNIKNASFKGELGYFHAMKEEDENSFTASIGVDYSFKNGIYINGGLLYNSNGTTSPISQLFSFELSAKNLYPYTFTIFGQTSYAFTPLLNGGLALIYSPNEVHPLFINPTITYSIQQNWDIDLVGQVVYNQEDVFKSPLQAFFLRLKFSF